MTTARPRVWRCTVLSLCAAMFPGDFGGPRSIVAVRHALTDATERVPPANRSASLQHCYLVAAESRFGLQSIPPVSKPQSIECKLLRCDSDFAGQFGTQPREGVPGFYWARASPVGQRITDGSISR